MEVEVREEASSGRTSSRYPSTLLGNNTPGYPLSDAPVVVVRVEEVLLVALVLVIWVAAIALFFNRWGKIRMLEPYQPKFHQQPHRPSCPLAPLSPPGLTNQARMSFSKYNVNALTDPLSVLPSPIIRRPRQNSVFVGSSTVAMLNPPPRRVKSAIDIQYLIVNDPSPTASLKGNRKGSIIPILHKERRPSLITIERPYYSRHRPSITIERPHLHQNRHRRLSCFAERTQGRHRNFISFEHNFDRKLPLEKPSCSFHPTISFETPMESMELPTLPIKLPSLPPLSSTGAIPKVSRSFEQPYMYKEKSITERSSHSLDASSINFDSKSSDDERASPIFINMEETRITAPLLESLKSSDV